MSSKPRSRISGTGGAPRAPVTVHGPKLELVPELARLISNWLQWRGGGVPIAVAMAYSSIGVLRRDHKGGGAQVIVAEAERTNRSIMALPGEQRQAFVVWWCQGGAIRDKARRCGCRPSRMYDLLELAHARLRAELVKS